VLLDSQRECEVSVVHLGDSLPLGNAVVANFK